MPGLDFTFQFRPPDLPIHPSQMLEHMWDDALHALKIAADLEENRRGPRPGRRRTKPKKAE